MLYATLDDAKDGELEVKRIEFNDNILTLEHDTPPSHYKWISKEGQQGPGTMTAWLKFRDDRFVGALSSGKPADFEFDFRVTGTRVTPAAP